MSVSRRVESRTLNGLIDTADLLQGARSADDLWVGSAEMVHTRYGNALNVVELDARTGEVQWFRSSMNSDWLTDYLDQSFMDIDPLLIDGLDGQPCARMVSGWLDGYTQQTQQNRALQDQIHAWDYHTLDFFTLPGSTPGGLKAVTISREWGAPEATDTDRIFATLIGTGMTAPLSADSPGATPHYRRKLSQRERDVLRYLAAGQRNDVIAWKMGIAEVTVRAHITSARRKLGAKTREQAIAMALRAGLLPL